jgi:hypothetical protein
MGYVRKQNCFGIREDEWCGEEIAAEIKLSSDSTIIITVEGTTVVIYEPCDLSPEEALKELVAMVVELYEPACLCLLPS